MHRQRQRRRASTGVADAPELGRQAHMATTITGAGPGADTGGPSAAGSSYTRGRGIWRTIVGLWDKLAGRERLRVPQHDREGFEPIGARLAW
jgi:hypothetical protein